jgi:ADP-heptose:LPS heptosyltransferase
MQPYSGPSLLKSVAFRSLRGFVHSASWLIDLIFYAWRSAPDPSQVRQILVFKLDSLGDFVLALPALLALRRSYVGARFTFVTSGQCVGIANFFGGDVVRYDSPFFYPYGRSIEPSQLAARARQVSRLPADLIIDFRSDPLTLIVALMSRAKYRVELGGQRILPVLKKLRSWRTSARAAAHHESDVYVGALRRLGLRETQVDHRVRQTLIDSALARKALGLLRQGPSVRGNDSYIVMHIGGSAAHKRWPCNRFTELAVRLYESLDLPCVLVGSSSEQALLESVVPLPDGVIDLVGSTSIDVLFALVSGAEVVVANDSAVGHIAAFLGRPLVSVYGGPSSKDSFAPRGAAPTRLLQGRCVCVSAEQDQCAAGQDRWCLGSITVDRVEREVRDLLNSLESIEKAAGRS